MEIVLASSFLKKLSRQLNYISYDSPKRAKNFKNDLFIALENLKYYPFKHRKSIYFNNENIRDLIFKGYTITYEVLDSRIEVVGLLKYENTIK